MLSILIPVYNYKVVKLVQALQKQCEKIKRNYEIIVFDDQSESQFKAHNKILSGYFGVNYTELSENLGRARIRNWLAKSARYENLLFLDCDSKIVRKDFVISYFDKLTDFDLVSGGRIYAPKEPKAYTKRLHWLYGTYKESRSALERTKFPVKYFHSNNFLIRRDVIMDVPFKEDVTGYGYEDLHLAKALKEKGYRIEHIENPVEHLGLEKNKTFLSKTRTAIDNLLHLKYTGHAVPTNLENAAIKMYDLGFHEDFRKFYEKREKSIENNLLSKHPRLRNLDFYKLNYYFEQRNKWIRGKRSQ